MKKKLLKEYYEKKDAVEKRKQGLAFEAIKMEAKGHSGHFSKTLGGFYVGLSQRKPWN